MFIMAFLERNRSHTQQRVSSDTGKGSSYTGELDSSYINSLIICELRLTHDYTGYQLSVTPDFSPEPYIVRGVYSE
ncbi:hypothetical protein BIW11_13225, partial [Tropilaelaps mercedesae]